VTVWKNGGNATIQDREGDSKSVFASSEPKRTCRTAAERRRARAQHDRADHHGQLIDQTVGQQFIPEHAAAEDQDVLSDLAFEFGDSSARSRT
jgi:hypothetical protein